MQIKEKNIGRILWLLAIAICVLVGLLASCSVVDRIEASHYHFYYHTKALIVVKKEGKRLYCRSAAGVKYYRVMDYYNQYQAADTIDLRYGQNEWVYANTKFINRIP